MSKRNATVIQVKEILTRGLVAGLIIILSALLMVPAVGDQMEAALRARGLPPLGAGAAAFCGLLSLGLGVILVWLYAVVSPRLGRGPKTAVMVSLLVWFLAYFQANASNVAFGFLPLRLAAIGTAWGLVELVVAGVVGARLYREPRSS
jgi:hypothetical protein